MQVFLRTGEDMPDANINNVKHSEIVVPDCERVMKLGNDEAFLPANYKEGECAALQR